MRRFTGLWPAALLWCAGRLRGGAPRPPLPDGKARAA
jgi:hypothetical protein